MGGEYLPDLEPGEVEIVRIGLKSTMADQISVRARQAGQKIRYAIADEYETAFQLPFRESTEPLSLDELVAFLDGSKHPDDQWPGGLIQSHWNYLYDDFGEIEEAVAFVSVESTFYPQLDGYYSDVGARWIAQRYHEPDEQGL